MACLSKRVAQPDDPIYTQATGGFFTIKKRPKDFGKKQTESLNDSKQDTDTTHQAHLDENEDTSSDPTV